MELYERIEKTRFLGREFLVWLWWKTELFEGAMTLPEAGACEVWLDDQLTLEARGESVEQSKLKGSSPSTTPEAREALRQGKVPTKARISITKGERDFSLAFDGESFTLSGCRTPALLQDEKEERFYERMYLIEELEEAVQELYKEFLTIRTSPKWDSDIAPAIRDWVREQPTMTPDGYSEILMSIRKSILKKPVEKASKTYVPPKKTPEKSNGSSQTTESETETSSDEQEAADFVPPQQAESENAHP